jgi:hypothetical protein
MYTYASKIFTMLSREYAFGLALFGRVFVCGRLIVVTYTTWKGFHFPQDLLFAV